MPACMDCVWVRGTDAGVLECRRNAPSVSVVHHAARPASSGVWIPESTTSVTRFPTVDAMDSCGEFKDAMVALLPKEVPCSD